MNKQRLVVTIMGQNCEKFIGMCLKSVKDADAIVYCDGGSRDRLNLINLAQAGLTIIENPFDQEDKQMNGKQRNFYLDYIKKEFPDDWCLVIDADEVVEDLSKVKEFIQKAKEGIYSVKMRHFIGDLGHEDNTRETHFVPNRLFKIDKATSYPLHSHPVLEGPVVGATDCTTVWHLGHLPVEYMHYITKRYNQHSNDSVIHAQDFLKEWKKAHLFGQYPSKPINPIEIPKVILDNFEIDFDELYFANRGLELKHGIMVKQWNEFFKPKSVLDVGCGLGTYLYFWEGYLTEILQHIKGIELSEYAVKNQLCPQVVEQGNILDMAELDFSLVTAVDILEH